MDQTVAQARYLTSRIMAEPDLTLMAPTATTVVCFRHDPGDMAEPALRAHNTEIMLRLQEGGVAVISDTTLRGKHTLRLAICNHRTRTEDLDLLLHGVLRIGHMLLAPDHETRCAPHGSYPKPARKSVSRVAVRLFCIIHREARPRLAI